jgi:glycosyltransferase involved in cell wall biosynthesis
MRILLINHYAGSLQHGMEFRPYYMAREWQRSGHSVRVLAASHSHVRARQPDLDARNPTRQTVDDVDYAWYHTPPYFGNGVGRARNMLSFCRQLWFDAHRLAEEFHPDVVIASSTYPMDIWPARRIARRARAKLIYEVHDLWPLSPMQLGSMSASHPFIRICQRAEDDACRDADVVVSMLPCVQDHLTTHGLDPARLHIVPNGIDIDEWQREADFVPSTQVQTIAERAHRQRRLLVGYAGAHGLANALDSLLDAAALLRDEADFVLVGDGPEKVRLRNRVEREGLRNVTLLPPVPKVSIPGLLSTFDVAYIGLQRQPLFRFGIAPNKLMDYMMAGRPVLMAIEAGNDPVAEAGCGVSVRAEDSQEICTGLRRLATLGEAERRAMGERGRAYVVAHHGYTGLARRFLEAVA